MGGGWFGAAVNAAADEVRELRATSGLTNPSEWLRDAFGGVTTWAGTRVNQRTALQYAPFFSGVRLIAQTVAGIPLITYRRLDPRGKMRDRKNPWYDILHSRFNEEHTAFDGRAFLQQSALLWGNGYAFVDRAMSRQPLGLWPLRPDRCHLERSRETGELVLVWSSETLGTQYFERDEFVHLRSPLSFDGVYGMSILTQARESIGAALASEEFAGRFWSNSARPDGALKTPNTLSDEAWKRLKKQWKDRHQGSGNAHKTAILEEGLEWQAIGMPLRDAQWFEGRKFSRTEMATWLGIPPHKLGDLERATFSNIEEQSIEFVQDAIIPWLVAWEQVLSRDLLSRREVADGVFFEHLVQGLLRGKLAERYTAYGQGFQMGMLSPDDIRELENLNPREDGRGGTYYVPLNMVPARKDLADDDSAALGPETRGLRSERRWRSQRSAATRRHLAQRSRRLFEDSAARVLRRERDEVLQRARRDFLRRDTADFVTWLRDWYPAEHRDFVGRTAGGAFEVYGSLVADVAFEEIGADDATRSRVDLTPFYASLAAAHATRWTLESQSALEKVVRDNPEGELDALEAKLDEWRDGRPGQVARHETVQAQGAVTRKVYRESGILRLQWVATGDTCPLCLELDGQIVGIENAFVVGGGGVDADGVSITKPRNTLHPPLHGGCDCQIVAAA